MSNPEVPMSPRSQFAFLALLSVGFIPCRAATDRVDLDRLTPVASEEPIPVQDFFRPPGMLAEPKINLSGTHIAALVTNGSDKQLLLVNDLKTRKSDVIGGPGDINVTSFDWLNEGRLVYNLGTTARGNLGLLAVDLDQPNRGYPLLQYYNETLLSVPKDDRTHPLIWAAWDGLESQKQLGVVAVDSGLRFGQFVDLSSVTAGTMDAPAAEENNTRHIVRRYPSVDGWATNYYADQLGELAFATTAADGVYSLHFLAKEQWVDCPVDLDQISIVGAGTKHGELAIVGPRGTGRPRPLQFMDGATGRLGEVLVDDKDYDFNGYLYRDPGSQVIVGAVYERNGPQVVWFHPAYAKLQEVLNGFFPGVVARIIGNNEKGDIVLVKTYSDRQPPIYQWVNLETKQVGLIMNSAPWIDPKRMRPVNIIKFKTRDGHSLDAYVTMPAGATKQNPPPLIVLPHDGPLGERTRWEYNAQVQFFASRGYAVLQPNYRGSAGYGWMFPESDDWDYVKMGQDVIDATKLLGNAGLIDAKRVGIVGTNFGGFLALQCAASAPDLFKCAGAITGIFDWGKYVDDFKFSRYTTPQYGRWVRKLGDPDRDRARYDAISPLRHVEAIRAAVFTAIGREDSEQLIAQTKSLNSELERHHVPHESVTLGGAGNSMFYVRNRVEVYSQLETFLAKNLK